MTPVEPARPRSGSSSWPSRSSGWPARPARRRQSPRPGSRIPGPSPLGDRDQEGRLGIGVLDPAATRGRVEPQPVHLPDGTEVVDACACADADADATIALTGEGDVDAWGGPGRANDTASPQRTASSTGRTDPVVEVESGAHHPRTRTRDGQVFSRGSPTSGSSAR
jgi:hypothetical protein